MLVLISTNQTAKASGTISGAVYSDYNMNGIRNTTGTSPNYAVDGGIGGVTVTVYDQSGTIRGSAVTCSALNTPTNFCTGTNNGAYSVGATGTGPYRMEFTTLPTGYSPSSVGANNNSTVRFVADGNSTNNDLGVVEPKEYCQNSPYLVTNSYIVGDSAFAALVAYPYNYSDELDGNILGSWTAVPSRTTTLTPTVIGDAQTMGATFGVAWNNLTGRVYASAYLKRGARFGSLSGESTGAIYVVHNPLSATPTTGVLVNLNTIFGASTAGANTHPTSTTSDWTNDAATISEIGKRGMGGLKLSRDGANLYAVNLADKRLYVIPTSGALDATTVKRFDIPTTNLATSSGNCATADVRPFAVGRDRSGQIYVGAVCSAESETADTKLHAYVWRFDNPGFTLVANNNLTFARTAATNESATWQRWANVTDVLNRAAPMLTDIEFDGNQMILGLRDRYGDQVVLPDFYRGYGDVMRACANGNNFTFESNGSCGGVTAGGSGTGESNGGGEYYADLNGDNREEGALGGLVQVPGFNHVIATFYDPVAYNSAGTRVNNYYTAGIQRYNNTTGALTGAYDIYLDADLGNFGKADGLGDSEVLCAAAPLQIGNRVWTDTDLDGVQDAAETGIQNVAVQLWADTNGDNTVDTQVGATTTDATGSYVFGGVNNTGLLSTACGTGSVDVRVNNSADDAEQNLADNSVNLASLDLELTADGATLQTVGVRFNYLNIPQGSTITNAYLEFTPRSDNTTINTGNPAMTIRAENSDQAATFAATTNNISGRATTAASVNWSPGNWTSGTAAQTPNLSAVVQQVVNRAGWLSGNSMAFVLSGAAANNFRRAWAFDGGGNDAAPRLVIQYTPSCRYTVNPNTRYEIRIPSANFGSGQPLNGRYPTTANVDASANGDSRDSDGILIGSQPTISLLTGSYGQNNHTYDFGFFVPATAAQVNVGGLVANAFGRGIGNVSVALVRADGTVLRSITNPFGYYNFEGVPAGETVIVSVFSKRHVFTQSSQAVAADEDVENVNFVAEN